MRYSTMLFLLLLGSVVEPGRAFADGECFKGYHDITPQESATMTTVLESARAAVPAPPAGWTTTLNDDSVSPPSSVCLDFSPWTYAYGRAYSRVEGAEAREQAEAAAGAQIRAMMAARQPRLDALQAELDEVSRQYGAAATSGDDAKVAFLEAEMERLSAEYEQVMNEGDPLAAFEAATAGQYDDLEMSVSVRVNSGGEGVPDGAQPIEISGATSAWQWTSGDDGKFGNALVLFGPWKPAPSGYGLAPTGIPGGAPEQPQAISVNIWAHKDRLSSMIEATDFGALAALLKR